MKAPSSKPVESARSKETVDTDSEDESSSEADSEGDLEDVQPKRKSMDGAVNGGARPAGGSWP